MNCAEIHPLLHAYVDGELDLVRNLDVEQHLKTCTGCAAKAKSLRSLRAALQKNDLAYRAPASLRQHVRQIAGGSREKSGANENNLLRLWQWIAAGATDMMLKFDLNGKPLAAWGKSGAAAGAFHDIHGFGVDSNGVFYASEAAGGRTQRFTPKPGVDQAMLVGPPQPLAPLKKQ